VPVTSIKFRLDWASTTVAPPISDMPQRCLKPFSSRTPRAVVPPPELNLPDPRLRQRNARAAVPSLDQFRVRKLGAERILPMTSSGPVTTGIHSGRLVTPIQAPRAVPPFVIGFVSGERR